MWTAICSCFSLRGQYGSVHMLQSLLSIVNPFLGGSGTGVALAPGMEQVLVLSYGLYEELFRPRAWEDIDSYEMFLQMTSAYTRKEIQVNG